MRISILFASIIVLILACQKDENESFKHCPSKTIQGKKLGSFYNDHFTSILLEEEICLIFKNNFQILPFDTTQQAYEIEVNSTDAQVDGDDLIVLSNNTFSRLDPNTRQQTTLFSPDELDLYAWEYTVTPGLGITYYGAAPFGESTGEPGRFGFYDFATKTHTKIYDFKGEIDLWEDEWYVWPDQFYTTLEESELILTIQETKSTETHRILQVNTDNQTILKDTIVSHGVFIILKVLDKDNFVVSYSENPRSSDGYSTYAYYNVAKDELTNGSLVKEGYNYLDQPINESGWSTLNYSGYVSVGYERQFIDWENQKSYFSIDDWRRNWEDEYFNYDYDHHETVFIYYYRESNGYLMTDGCISHVIEAKDPIHDILFMTDDKIILNTEKDEILLFELL